VSLNRLLVVWFGDRVMCLDGDVQRMICTERLGDGLVLFAQAWHRRRCSSVLILKLLRLICSD
jgi:hypothetical protein